MRALLIVLDSLGVGSAPDDLGPPARNTLGQLFHEVPDLELPTLFSLGLGEILKGRVFDPPARVCAASYGRMIQRSAGSDALSALWELAGVILGCPFSTFEQLPPEFLRSIAQESGSEFLLNRSNQPALTPELRKEHLRTGHPILTFDPEGVLHIAAHEAAMPLARLIQIARITRRHSDAWRIAQVIAEPFQGDWEPSNHALRLSLVPPRTILNALSDKGLPVEAIGSINDAFAQSGITHAHPTLNRAESLSIIERLWRAPQNGMVFAHMENSGCAVRFARALEEFDRWLGQFLNHIESDDLILITGSNNGADRQEVPILVRYGGHTEPLGVRETFADVAATLGAFFKISEHGHPWNVGEPLITFHRPRGYNGP